MAYFQQARILANWQKKTNLAAPATDLGLGVGAFEFWESIVSAPQRYCRAADPLYWRSRLPVSQHLSIQGALAELARLI